MNIGIHEQNMCSFIEYYFSLKSFAAVHEALSKHILTTIYCIRRVHQPVAKFQYTGSFWHETYLTWDGVDRSGTADFNMMG
jgi:hypothetical protein